MKAVRRGVSPHAADLSQPIRIDRKDNLMRTVTAPKGSRRRAEPRAYRRPPAWHALAACASADPDSWYPEQNNASSAVLRTCASCIVKTECLDQAIEDGERHGIWGGLNRAQRNAITTAAGSERAA
jgi:hypothetical protein